jgi:hypothetical protein
LVRVLDMAIGRRLKQALGGFFIGIDVALFKLTAWVSLDPIIGKDSAETAARVDGGNLFVVTLDDGLRRPLGLSKSTQPTIHLTSSSAISGKANPEESKTNPESAAATGAAATVEQASGLQRRVSILEGLQRMLTRRGTVASQAAVDSDGLQRTLTFADPKLWVDQVRQLYASRISFPRHKYEVFRPSQLNFSVFTLWALIAITMLLAIAGIAYTKANQSDYFLFSTTFLYVATVGGLIESVLCLVLYLFFTVRVFSIPPADRTRMQYIISVMTFVLFWQTEPLTVLLKLIDSAKLAARVPRVVVAFQLVGNLAFYIGTIGFMLLVFHLYRIREIYRISWFIFLTPKVLVLGVLAGLGFVLFFVGRVMPSRLPLLALIGVIRAGRYTGLWDYDTVSIVSVLSFVELFSVVLIVYEMRRTWECLNQEGYSLCRSRQLGFRLFLNTTCVAYLSLWLIMILVVSIMPTGFNTAIYYLSLAQNRLPTFFTSTSQVDYYLSSVFFDPLYSSNVYFVLNTITIAVVICNVLMYLPPETPKLLAKFVCCLATSRNDMFSQYVCCRDEPKPFFRWARLYPVESSTAADQLRNATMTKMVASEEQPRKESSPLRDGAVLSAATTDPSEASMTMARGGGETTFRGSIGSGPKQSPWDHMSNTWSSGNSIRALQDSRSSRQSRGTDAVPVLVPILRRFVFSIETMVEQFNLSWVAYMLDPTNPSPRYVQSQRFWKESLRIFFHEESDTLGFVIETEDRIALSFRGTRSRKNLQTDMRTGLVELYFPNKETDAAFADRLLRCGSFYSTRREELNPLVRVSDTASRLERYLHIRSRDRRPRVHDGFLTSYLSIADEVERELTSRYKSNPRPIVISGHSLGGALANLAALHLSIRLELSDTSVMLTTFGAPRVGDMHFARLLDFLTPIHFRVTNAADAVARLPFTGLGGWFAWGASAYTHAGVQVLLNKHGLLRVDPSIVELEFQFRVGAYIEPHLKRGYRRSMEAWVERSCPDGWRPDFWTFPKKAGWRRTTSSVKQTKLDEGLTGKDLAPDLEATEESEADGVGDEAMEENMDILADEGNVRSLIRRMTFVRQPLRRS